MLRSGEADDIDDRARDQPSLDHAVEVRKQFLNLVFRIYDAHHDRRILRNGQAAGMIDSGRRAESLDPAEDNRARDSEIHAGRNDGLMQWLTLPFVRFREMNAQHSRLELFFHGSLLVVDDLRGPVRVLDDVSVGENDQTLLDHLLDNRQKGVQLFLGIDDGEHKRAVVR